MSGLTTDFTQSPYWDDYNAAKQYYRILFVPKLAVQVREINQLQTMFQEQVSRFGNHIFKDGSIVSGCNITHLPRLDFVRTNAFTNTDSNTQFTTAALSEYLAVSANTGLRASVLIANPGYVGTYPDTNVLYVNYLNKGRDTGNNEVTTFGTGETLQLYSNTQDKFANLNPGLLYNTTTVFNANTSANQTSIGQSYAIRVGDGIVYQKGYFVNVIPHTILVKKYDRETENMLVGFQTKEAVITYLQDPTLIDPADTAQRSGIGANRLKLTPELIAINRSTLTPTDNFFPIIEFGANNTPVKQNADPAYAKLGDAIAQRTFEESGDYYVKPFIVGSKSTANTELLRYTVDPGIAYVKGNRVQLIGTIELEATRATTLGEHNANIVTLNYGNYINVNEYLGNFNADKLVTVDIYDTIQTAITSNRPLTTPTGTKIGTANVRAVTYDSGTKGLAGAIYNVFITNIVMNTGKSFVNDAKAFYISAANNGNVGAFADLILTGGKAVLKESGASGLIFDTGVVGTRRLRDGQGVNDTQYTFRDTATATLQANGVATFTLNTPYAGGIERFFASAGALSTANKLRVDITATNNLVGPNLAGTVNANTGNTTILGTGTAFNTNFAVGEYINMPTVGLRRVTAIANSTSMTVNANVTGGSVTSTYNKAYIAGSTLNLANAAVNVVSNTQFIVDLGATFTSGAPQTLVASYPVIRSEATEIKKVVNRGSYVKIDCSANTTGPFNLGVVDVFSVAGVYVGDAYSENNPDRKDWFNVDNGQLLSHYDHAKLILKPEFQGKLTASTKILVKLNHFTANNTTGIGFFSVDSYPVRAPGVAANTTNISYEDIPEIQGYNLRNCVDFRPQKINTANVTTNANTATINPAISNTSFNVSVAGTFIGEPDTTFQTDLQYYLPRYDLIQVNSDGIFSVKSSVATEKPSTPIVDGDSMAIATSYVPPYPGIAQDESALYISTKPRIRTSLTGNRGYTMKDINALDKRISILEYYQALSMLEQQAKDYTVKDENGLDRFKNGIFADPLKNHLLGDVSNFEYDVAIDEVLEIARPKIKKNNVDLDLYSSTNITTNSQITSLAYTRELLITQPYASKFRNVTESVWSWRGVLDLFPDYDHHQDEQALPAVNVTVDLASQWQQFANSPFGQNFGDWRVVDSWSNSSTNTTGLAGSRNGAASTTTTTTTTTTNVLQQSVQSLNVGTSQTKQDLGSYITDVTLNPYMRSRNIAFIATGMRPNTRVYLFFDSEPVSQFSAPGALNPLIFNPATGEATITSGKEDQVVNRKGNFGDPIVTDANGNVYGIFNIPDQKFRVGDRTLRIVDVDSLVTGSDAILTSASAVYTASSITTTSRNMSLTTIQPTLSTTNSTNTVVQSSTSVTSRTENIVQPTVSGIRDTNNSSQGSADPLGQSFYINIPNGISGIFAEAIGVYFRGKDSTLGITCYIVEMNAGVPDPTRVVGVSYLKPSAITTSNDSSVETIFKFANIPYLTASKSYAYFLRPDGDSPNYTVWMSELGGTDILTGNMIFTNPYLGVAFKSANSETWDALSTEDIKFNLYRCNFTSLSGSVVLSDQEDEYLSVNGFSFSNSSVALQVGDVVYTQNTTGGIITGANTPFGIVQSYDQVNDTLTLDSSTGGFTSNTVISIFRPSDPSNTALLTSNNLIATSRITSVDNLEYSIVVPRVATTTPSGTSVAFSYKGIDATETQDGSWSILQPEAEVEFIDKMRVIKSKSNRTTTDKSAFVKIDLESTNNFISPVIDLRRRSMYAIENIVNNDVTNEHTRNGNALTRYISRQITLAEGQDAEDIKVLISAYRPADTDIHCYIKLQSASDPDSFYDKLWTKLDMSEGSAVRSSSVDTNDYREFGFSFPQTEQLQGTAWRDAINNGVVQYRNSTGTVFIGYKTFALKFVFTTSQRQRVPRLDDIRGIALQL